MCIIQLPERVSDCNYQEALKVCLNVMELYQWRVVSKQLIELNVLDKDDIKIMRDVLAKKPAYPAEIKLSKYRERKHKNHG